MSKKTILKIDRKTIPVFKAPKSDLHR